MPDYDVGFKIVARQAGPQLSRLAGMLCQEWQPIGDTIQTTERLADRAFRARHGRERFVVYLEAYTRWHASAPWNMLAKSALLSERERLPTVTLVFILLPRGYRAQNGQFRLQVAGAPTQQVWFREVCLWLQEPQAWWEEAPGLMPLYPLCRHSQSAKHAVVHAARTITERVSDRIARADLLTTLYLFGKLAYPQVDALQLIGREHMRESKAYEEIMTEGRLEGKLEGRLEGRLEEKRADVYEVIQVRYGQKAATELQQTIQASHDLEQLAQVLRLAIRGRPLAEVRRAVAAMASER